MKITRDRFVTPRSSLAAYRILTMQRYQLQRNYIHISTDDPAKIVETLLVRLKPGLLTERQKAKFMLASGGTQVEEMGSSGVLSCH